MQKNIIALAIAGAIVAPAALAQTANPVTLYGRVYVTVESVEAKGGANPIVRRERVEDQSSLFGIRGTEDLGGGLKLFFQLETPFRADSNVTTFASRNSGIGLQGGWGTLLAGRWDTPYKVTTYPVDLYLDLTNGAIVGTLHDRGNFDRREQNVLQYWTPTVAGFAARISVTSNEGRTATLSPRSYSGNVTYTKGPFYAFYAYEEHQDVSATIGKEKGNTAGGYIQFGPVKVGAVYEQIEKTGLTDKKGWLGNLLYTLGKHQLGWQYMTVEDGAAANAAQPECDSNSVSYFYNFSKRTFLIAQYIRIDNNEASSVCNFGANALPLTAGQDPRGLSVGLRHVF